mmetsp:Transcript_3956/g.12853  ORF Transcript_3956/g.12853 Transcript_3956/m.12853 type:complete len:240 (+) Transcript_3956:566-1285(+)
MKPRRRSTRVIEVSSSERIISDADATARSASTRARFARPNARDTLAFSSSWPTATSPPASCASSRSAVSRSSSTLHRLTIAANCSSTTFMSVSGSRRGMPEGKRPSTATNVRASASRFAGWAGASGTCTLIVESATRSAIATVNSSAEVLVASRAGTMGVVSAAARTTRWTTTSSGLAAVIGPGGTPARRSKPRTIAQPQPPVAPAASSASPSSTCPAPPAPVPDNVPELAASCTSLVT